MLLCTIMLVVRSESSFEFAFLLGSEVGCASLGLVSRGEGVSTSTIQKGVAV